MKKIIYRIINNINKKLYIGQTNRGIRLRWKSHVYESLILKHDYKINRAIRKYGPENFTIEVIEEVENYDEREAYWISFYKSGQIGYNIKPGGAIAGHAESTKIKIGKANSEREWTNEMRETMSVAIQKWHDARGFVPKSDEFKKKIVIANTGRPMSSKTSEIFQSYNKSQSVSIICDQNGEEYLSKNAACRALGLNVGHMSCYFNGKCSHIKGYTFKVKV